MLYHFGRGESSNENFDIIRSSEPIIISAPAMSGHAYTQNFPNNCAWMLDSLNSHLVLAAGVGVALVVITFQHKSMGTIFSIFPNVVLALAFYY